MVISVIVYNFRVRYSNNLFALKCECGHLISIEVVFYGFQYTLLKSLRIVWFFVLFMMWCICKFVLILIYVCCVSCMSVCVCGGGGKAWFLVCVFLNLFYVPIVSFMESTTCLSDIKRYAILCHLIDLI